MALFFTFLLHLLVVWSIALAHGMVPAMGLLLTAWLLNRVIKRRQERAG